jgi:ribosomal-protein-alanine N-acetyltransferase
MIDFRPYTEVIPEHLDWLNDPDLMRFSEQRHIEHTPETVMAYAAAADYFCGIYDGDKFVGTIAGHVDRWNDVCDLGILVGISGYSYGGRAWRKALSRLDHRMITAGAMAYNWPMVRIMQETMEYDHTRSGIFMYKGAPADGVFYRR